jgi:hypothetical protein
LIAEGLIACAAGRRHQPRTVTAARPDPPM